MKSRHETHKASFSSGVIRLGLVVGLGASALLLAATFAKPSHAEVINDDTPVPAVGELGGPFRELNAAEMEMFKRGRKLFDRDWKQSQGLGTEMNADSCRGCHQTGGFGGSGGLDLNVFRFARDFGDPLLFEDLPGGQAGSKIRRPDTPGREDHHPDADVFEQRQTPPVFGLGLVSDIPDAEILANEDPTDSNGDGIKGVARMIDVGGVVEVGKFGWKAQLPQLLDFLSDAAAGELGVTTPDNGRGFAALNDTDGVADPEMTPDEFTDGTFFLMLLAPPPRVGSSDPLVALGEQVFEDVGCATCHIPSLEGAEGPVNLYSDLLLHDIHGPTFRGMSEPGAGVGFYRTVPLWGARLSDPYLHDGRAETILDAVMMHTAEAEGVRQAFEALSGMEQDALIKFVEDL